MATGRPIAGRGYAPPGAAVVHDGDAPDNADQGSTQRGRLPIRDGLLAVVANRRNAFLAAEVSRIPSPGGVFITQQVDFHTYDDLYCLLGWRFPSERHEFRDVSAVVHHLRWVSWLRRFLLVAAKSR